MNLNRREFLKLAGLSAAGILLPRRLFNSVRSDLQWPTLTKTNLSLSVNEILTKVPDTILDQAGYLKLLSPTLGQKSIPLARTAWNLEHNNPFDRLDENVPWGIVIHWYGEKDNFNKTLQGYLQGFDGLRLVDDYYTRTSAHFLVADGLPQSEVRKGNLTGIIQTQIPDVDGIPFLASHLQGLDYQAHHEGKQYFVRALYQLSYSEPTIHSMLQDFFDGPYCDPNLRTVAIEVTGYNFDYPENFPSKQQIANLVSVVWALMKRYNISAANILGHNEIQLGKADPGKKFLSLIRFLIGLKALSENDEKMKYLVFGQFLGNGDTPQQAVQKYFKFVRDYLMLVGRPQQVYEWEALCGYWFVYEQVANFDPSLVLPRVETYTFPFKQASQDINTNFLIPDNHEGIDLHPVERTFRGLLPDPVRLIAPGKCIYLGEETGLHLGKCAMFRHRQADGAEIVSVFGHLKEHADLSVGNAYSLDYPIGYLENHLHHPAFLHFAIAYGATWDLDLHNNPQIPLNAGSTWIQERYIEPGQYLRTHVQHPYYRNRSIHFQ